MYFTLLEEKNSVKVHYSVHLGGHHSLLSFPVYQYLPHLLWTDLIIVIKKHPFHFSLCVPELLSYIMVLALQVYHQGALTLTLCSVCSLKWSEYILRLSIITGFDFAAKTGTEECEMRWYSGVWNKPRLGDGGDILRWKSTEKLRKAALLFTENMV